MKILTINAGSSSMKFSVMEIPENRELINGYFQRIGLDGSFYDLKMNGEKLHRDIVLNDHLDALECIKKEVVDLGIVANLDDIDAVGHRVVHGGEEFKQSVLVDDSVIEKCRKLSKLAPLHNPANVTCIEAAIKAFPGKPQVVVFDTSFLQTMEPANFLYPVPYEWYQKYGVRKYGAHGTSHKYVYQKLCEELGNDNLKVISCHLGSGASVCAIDAGKVVDISMGFSPLAGVMMGTRSGDIDPTVVQYMMEETGMSVDEVINALNKQSGFLGVCGYSDSRDVEAGIKDGNELCILAQEMYARRVANYIANYNNQLNGADAIIFTAGLGENAIDTRRDIVEKIASLNVFLDSEKNNFRGEFRKISTEDSKISVYVVPTNEELMIAQDTYDLVK